MTIIAQNSRKFSGDLPGGQDCGNILNARCVLGKGNNSLPVGHLAEQNVVLVRIHK